MSYIKPELAISPKSRLKNLEVIHDGGQNKCDNKNWSMAKMEWDRKDRIGLRWNGDDEDPAGNPKSHGHATWFILPDLGELAEVIQECLKGNIVMKKQLP